MKSPLGGPTAYLVPVVQFNVSSTFIYVVKGILFDIREHFPTYPQKVTRDQTVPKIAVSYLSQEGPLHTPVPGITDAALS